MSRFSQKPDYYTAHPNSDLPIVPGGLNLPRKLDVFYIDVNRTFQYQDQKGLIVYDDDVVKRMVGNILSTPLGSDHFEPTFGSNLPYRLQDSITDKTAWLIYIDTIQALGIWLENQNVIALHKPACYVRPAYNNPDMEAYEIKMTYTILKTTVVSSFNSFLIR